MRRSSRPTRHHSRSLRRNSPRPRRTSRRPTSTAAVELRALDYLLDEIQQHRGYRYHPAEIRQRVASLRRGLPLVPRRIRGRLDYQCRAIVVGVALALVSMGLRRTGGASRKHTAEVRAIKRVLKLLERGAAGRVVSSREFGEAAMGLEFPARPDAVIAKHLQHADVLLLFLLDWAARVAAASTSASVGAAEHALEEFFRAPSRVYDLIGLDQAKTNEETVDRMLAAMEYECAKVKS